YIAVPAIPEYASCAEAQTRMADPQVFNRLNELRARPLVDYRGGGDLKLEILALLYRDFLDKHLATRSARGRQYLEFVAGHGRPLQLHARFDALNGFFRATRGCASGWMSWPQEYRDVEGGAAERFSQDHAAEVEFYVYLQWL